MKTKNTLQRWRVQMMKIMKKELNEIALLQYQIKRYQANGNGAICQQLNAKLQKLMNK